MKGMVCQARNMLPVKLIGTAVVGYRNTLVVYDTV